MSHSLPHELLDQLVQLVTQLRADSADFLLQQEDAQLWYNRGYANGVVRGLAALLNEDRPAGLEPDDENELAGQALMPWGKAYRHGESMGEQETYEIAGRV